MRISKNWLRGLKRPSVTWSSALPYGEPRLTRDIDITLGVEPEPADDLVEVARAAGLEVLVESISDFVHQTLVLPCQQPANGISCQ